MIIQKAIKVQIYPKDSDKELLAKHFGTKRFIFNKFLEIKQKEYIENNKNLSYNQCAGIVAKMKNDYEFLWLNEINAQTIQSAIKDVHTAYDRFFRKLSGFPKFKKKISNQSFKVPQYFKIDFDNNTIKIPKFKKAFKFRGKYIGKLLKVNSVVISMNPSGKYFASIQGVFDIEQKQQNTNSIGIDVGIKSLLVTSNGDKIENEQFLKKQLKKLKYLQRQHSKKKKESKSREKSRKRLAKQHQKVVNQRNNYLHQVSSKIINDNQVICLETLSIKNMIKDHNLAQAISDVSFGNLISMLEYKAKWHNRQVIKIDRWYPSSKTCSNCYHLLSNMKLSTRDWTCPECGIIHDRDINAAKNILQQGLNKLSGLGTKSDTKQKRVEALGSNTKSMKLEKQLV
jgi:putative transposase